MTATADNSTATNATATPAVGNAAVAGRAPLGERVVDAARRVHAGTATHTEAVAEGMYVPLGRGDVDIAAIVSAPESSGYAEWYVLEQDTILTGAPAPGGSASPDPVADVRASVDYLLSLAPGGAAHG